MNSQIQIENRFIFLRFSSLQKAMHLGSNPSLDQAGRSGYGGNDNRSLTKAFFRDILSAHYRQTDLKVSCKILEHLLCTFDTQKIYSN